MDNIFIFDILDNITFSANYIIEHYEKFLLLLLAILIIIAVDYISNINAVIYGVTKLPELGNKQPMKNEIISKKQKKHK